MKFININQLNALYERFEKSHSSNESFQSFVERARENGEAVCLDAEEIRSFLETFHDEDYDYLLECDDDDLKFHGRDYLKRINFFRRLLGAEELTLEDIKEDQRHTDCSPSDVLKQSRNDKMKMESEKERPSREMLGRLASHGVFISRNAPPFNNQKALILLGQKMLDDFVQEFVSLWQNELFANCLLKDYEASAEEVHEWVHGGDPQPDCQLCSNTCKEVNEKMDENVQTKLESYLELLEKIQARTQDERVATVLLTEISKDIRMERIKQEREISNGDPATDKQRKFMKKLGIDFPETVTKQEASSLIDEELSKNGG